MRHAFRLGVVLRLREAAELAARANLAEALRSHRTEIELAAEAADQVHAEARHLGELQLRSSAEADISAGILREAVDAVAVSTRVRDAAERRVGEAAVAVLESRERLADATRQRQLVERLRDRFRAAEALEDQRAENQVLDEIGSVRHSWRALEEVER